MFGGSGLRGLCDVGAKPPSRLAVLNAWRIDSGGSDDASCWAVLVVDAAPMIRAHVGYVCILFAGDLQAEIQHQCRSRWLTTSSTEWASSGTKQHIPDSEHAFYALAALERNASQRDRVGHPCWNLATAGRLRFLLHHSCPATR